MPSGNSIVQAIGGALPTVSSLGIAMPNTPLRRQSSSNNFSFFHPTVSVGRASSTVDQLSSSLGRAASAGREAAAAGREVASSVGAASREAAASAGGAVVGAASTALASPAAEADSEDDGVVTVEVGAGALASVPENQA